MSHAYALGGEHLMSRRRRAQRPAEPAPSKGGLVIQLPAAERGWSEADLARLSRLRTRLARIDLSPKKRDATEKELASLLNRPQADAEKAWQETAMTETETLAKARGEEVERRKAGVMEIRSRDPLRNLMLRGHLTAEQLDIGLQVRALYERRNASLGSQMGGLGGISSPTYDNSHAVLGGIQRAKALQRIGNLERAILTGGWRTSDGSFHEIDGWKEKFSESGSAGHALAMLRVVCEQGHPLTSQGKGSAFERNAASLARALDVAEDVLKGR